jgi:multicomponent Na+:H+ antiporter subunit D
MLAMGSKIYALRYLILNSIASGFILLGILILYRAIGLLNLNAIHEALHISGIHTSILSISAFLIFIGFFLKAGIFPFHSWMVQAYKGMPHVFLPICCSVFGHILLYLMIVIVYKTFGQNIIIQFLRPAVYTFCITGLIYTSYKACFETDVRKVFFYSSLSQYSYILLGIFALQLNALTGAIIHIVNNMLVNCGLFIAILSVCRVKKDYTIFSFAGLSRHQPVLSCCIAILLSSLVGLPFTLGFTSKFNILYGFISSENFFITLIILISSAISMIYLWRIFEIMYIKVGGYHHRSDLLANVSCSLVCVLIILFGTFTSFITEFAEFCSTILLHKVYV